MKLGIDPKFELEKRRGLKQLMESSTVPQTITTLPELTSALAEAERATFGEILKSIAIPFDELRELGTWSKDHYTRNCIVENERLELILLCWEPGQATPIHDHGGEECWVYIVDGNFKERIFTEDAKGELSPSKVTNATSGDLTYMNDSMGYHDLENLDQTRSLSIHLYAKPIVKCNAVNNATGEIMERVLAYDSRI